MYILNFRTKSNGVPILSKIEIDNIAERCLMEFCPQTLETPQPIDEDRFITDYLGLTQDFKYLSHCGVYLGMIVFEDNKKIVIYDEFTKRAEYITAKQGTIIIDSSLLEDGQEGRYRFTAMHEAGHWILHRRKFMRDINQMVIIFDMQNTNIQCRTVSIEVKYNSESRWNDESTMEWQANYFAGAILMPKSMVKKHCEDDELKDYLAFMSFGNREIYNDLLIRRTAEKFNVSKKAAEVRLCYLGIIDNRNTKNIRFDRMSFV